MKVLLDIKENNYTAFIEFLKGFKHEIKAKPITSRKAQEWEDFREALEQVRLHKEGKIELKSARDLLDEL